jgi:hypothetical protein
MAHFPAAALAAFLLVSPSSLMGQGQAEAPVAAHAPALTPAQVAALPELAVEGASPGTIEPSDPVTASGRHYDDYRIHLRAGESIRIDMPGNFDTYLELLAAGRREPLHYNDDAAVGSVTARLLFTAETEADYVVRASGWNGQTGTYTLESARLPSAPPPIALDAGAAYGDLTENSPLIDEDPGFGGEYRYTLYSFLGLAGERIRLDLSSSEFVPRLYLIGTGGDFSVVGEGGGPGSDVRLYTVLPRGGRYVVRAEAPIDKVGAFTIALIRSPPVPVRGGPPPLLARETAVTGNLEFATSDVQVGEANNLEFLYDLYRLEVDAGEVLDVELRSDDYAPVLDAGAQTPLGFALAVTASGTAQQAARLRLRALTQGTVVLRAHSSVVGPGRYTLRIVPPNEQPPQAAARPGAGR